MLSRGKNMAYVVVTVVLPSGKHRDLALPLEVPAGLLAKQIAQILNLEEVPYTFFVQKNGQQFRIRPELVLGRFPLLHGDFLYLGQDPQQVTVEMIGDGIGKAVLVGALGDMFLLKGEEIWIGRSDPSQGIFPDIDLTGLDINRTVSRRHARIVFRNGTYWLEDMHSVNGTRVNGKLLLSKKPTELQHGDRIEFGRGVPEFRFQIQKEKI